MRKKIRITESQMKRIITESVRKILRESSIRKKKALREAYGYDNEVIINPEDKDVNDLYRVGLWWGCGYQLDTYLVYAVEDWEALERVVAYIDKNNPEWLNTCDNNAEDYLKEIMEDEGIDYEKATESQYFQELYM